MCVCRRRKRSVNHRRHTVSVCCHIRVGISISTNSKRGSSRARAHMWTREWHVPRRLCHHCHVHVSMSHVLVTVTCCACGVRVACWFDLCPMSMSLSRFSSRTYYFCTASFQDMSDWISIITTMSKGDSLDSWTIHDEPHNNGNNNTQNQITSTATTTENTHHSSTSSSHSSHATPP